MQAVIPSVVVDDISGLKNLADCFVHVASINTTFYIDDKHRTTITWAGPVNVNNYDAEANPLNLRNQTVYDYANQKAYVYNNEGAYMTIDMDGGDTPTPTDNTLEVTLSNVTLNSWDSGDHSGEYTADLDNDEDLSAYEIAQAILGGREARFFNVPLVVDNTTHAPINTATVANGMTAFDYKYADSDTREGDIMVYSAPLILSGNPISWYLMVHYELADGELVSASHSVVTIPMTIGD